MCCLSNVSNIKHFKFVSVFLGQKKLGLFMSFWNHFYQGYWFIATFWDSLVSFTSQLLLNLFKCHWFALLSFAIFKSFEKPVSHISLDNFCKFMGTLRNLWSTYVGHKIIWLGYAHVLDIASWTCTQNKTNKRSF